MKSMPEILPSIPLDFLIKFLLAITLSRRSVLTLAVLNPFPECNDLLNLSLVTSCIPHSCVLGKVVSHLK